MTRLIQWRNRIATLPEFMNFSKFSIDSRTVFHATEFSYAFTNLKPVIPGHVLVSPIRVVDRLTLLSDREIEDLFATARLVGDVILKAHPHADSLTFTVQDGPSAGQTVPHVHVHIMPRWASDRFNSTAPGNDAVYEEINRSEREHASHISKVDEDGSVECRSRESMIAEGQMLRTIVEHFIR